MSPLSEGPCPHIKEESDFVFCSEYERRPEQCINHAFPGYRFCPVGLDVLGLSYPEDTDKIRIRIDTGHSMITRKGIIQTFEEWMKK